MKSIWGVFVDGWRTFITICEEPHNNLSKLNSRSSVAENCIVAMILGSEASVDSICLFAGA